MLMERKDLDKLRNAIDEATELVKKTVAKTTHEHEDSLFVQVNPTEIRDLKKVLILAASICQDYTGLTGGHHDRTKV